LELLVALERSDMAYAAVNGLKMHYEVHGDAPALMLLHGGGGPVTEKWISFFSP
jgi:hypothetical protein